MAALLLLATLLTASFHGPLRLSLRHRCPALRCNEGMAQYLQGRFGSNEGDAQCAAAKV